MTKKRWLWLSTIDKADAAGRAGGGEVLAIERPSDALSREAARQLTLPRATVNVRAGLPDRQGAYSRRSTILSPRQGPLMKLLITTWIVCALAVPALGDVVIDDFNSGPFAGDRTDQVIINPPNPPGTLQPGTFTEAQQSGTMVGGHRALTFFASDNPGEQTLHVDVGSGALKLAQGDGVRHRVDMAWGVDAAGANAPLNLDLSGEDRLRVTFLENTGLLNVNFVLFSDGGAKHWSMGLNVPARDERFTVDFPFSSFLAGVPSDGPLPAGDIDLIAMVTQSGPAGESYGIDSVIATVPEPSSLLLLSLGALGLGLRLRRQRRPAIVSDKGCRFAVLPRCPDSEQIARRCRACKIVQS